MARTSGSKRQTTSSGGSAAGRAKTTRSGGATGRPARASGPASAGPADDEASAGTADAAAAAKRRTSAAGATGATARARLGSSRIATARAARAGRAQTKGSSGTGQRATASVAEPTMTVPADDAVLAASNTTRALSPDMPRVAWLRTQLHEMEAQQRERLVKVAQLMAIAIVFITFVLQNAQGVDVHFLLFALNIRLIWVIFGCGLLGGVAGYLIGRPDRSLRALLPQKEKAETPPSGSTTRG